MENVIWAIVLWAIVFILIPFDRIKTIWPIAVLSTVWMFILGYTFIHLGYYHYTRYIAAIGGVPVFHLIGSGAGGLLLVNWLQRSALSKILIVAIFSGLLSLSAYIFMLLDVFKMTNGFNHILHFTVNVAGVSILVWLSLALVGEEKIYEGKRTRFTPFP